MGPIARYRADPLFTHLATKRSLMYCHQGVLILTVRLGFYRDTRQFSKGNAITHRPTKIVGLM